jgi:hypothetical protein
MPPPLYISTVCWEMHRIELFKIIYLTISSFCRMQGKCLLLSWRRGLVYVQSPMDTGAIGTMGREIESRQGKGW